MWPHELDEVHHIYRRPPPKPRPTLGQAIAGLAGLTVIATFLLVQVLPRVPHSAPSVDLQVGPGTVLPAAASGPQEARDVVAGQGKLVAVGWRRGATDGRADGAVWLFERGKWAPVTDEVRVFSKPKTQDLFSVIPYRGGFVAVGYDDAAGPATAIVYTSRTGHRWVQEAKGDDALSNGGSQVMRSIVARGRTLVAVGSRDEGGLPVPAAWIAPDGKNWQQAPLGDGTGYSGSTPTSDPGILYDVTYAGSQYVAVGGLPPNSAAKWGIERSELAVWTSPNGRRWRRLPRHAIKDDTTDLECDQEGCIVNQVMKGVVVVKGRLVAVGYSAPTGASSQDCRSHSGAIWVSANGSRWRRVSEPTTEGGVQLNTVAAYGTKRFVAAGQGCGEAAGVVWTSSDDGDNWKLLSGAPKDDLSVDASMFALTLHDKSGVIVGSHGTGSGDKKALAWAVKAK